MLRLYHDAAGTSEITSTNPDSVQKAVPAGETLTDERQVYLKSDDTTLTYEDVSIAGKGDEDGADESGEVDVQYAPDDGGVPGTYAQTLPIPDGDFAQSVPVWRKLIAPNVQNAFRRIDIEHEWMQSEYIK